MSTVKKMTESRICVGCGECVTQCANGAISMEDAELGFRMPKIDTEKCTDCGKCIKSCPFSDEYEEDD